MWLYHVCILIIQIICWLCKWVYVCMYICLILFSESVSEDESLSSVTLSPLPSQPLPPKQPAAPGVANEDDSPWDRWASVI